MKIKASLKYKFTKNNKKNIKMEFIPQPANMYMR